ncbi:MAG: hypothetical protein K2Y37_12515 [Pirellulales bacterium]|nr:hypothetical protein [Pirellulales bacterium]
MRGACDQLSVVLELVTKPAIVAGVGGSSPWLGPVRSTTIFDDFIEVVALFAFAILRHERLVNAFLGRASPTSSTPAAAATAAFGVTFAWSGFFTRARVASAGSGRILGWFVVELGVKISPQIGAGAGFIEVELCIGRRELIALSRGRTAPFARWAALAPALASTSTSPSAPPSASLFARFRS